MFVSPYPKIYSIHLGCAGQIHGACNKHLSKLTFYCENSSDSEHEARSLLKLFYSDLVFLSFGNSRYLSPKKHINNMADDVAVLVAWKEEIGTNLILCIYKPEMAIYMPPLYRKKQVQGRYK